MPNSIRIDVYQNPDRHTWTVVHDGKVILSHATQPFFQAARFLLDLGLSAEATLEMYRASSPHWQLRGPLGKAARLRVVEPDNGPMHLARYRPYVREEVDASRGCEKVA